MILLYSTYSRNAGACALQIEVKIRGDSCVHPLVPHGAVSPSNVPEKKKNGCALGMGCGHLASAS